MVHKATIWPLSKYVHTVDTRIAAEVFRQPKAARCGVPLWLAAVRRRFKPSCVGLVESGHDVTCWDVYILASWTPRAYDQQPGWRRAHTYFVVVDDEAVQVDDEHLI